MPKEILNHERIQLDEFISNHGPESVVKEMKSIFQEKSKDTRIQVSDRDFMEDFLKDKTTDPKALIRQVYNDFGAPVLMQSIQAMLSDIAKEWKHDSDMVKQLVKMNDALQMKKVKDAWGN